jgi:hypothetical protein
MFNENLGILNLRRPSAQRGPLAERVDSSILSRLPVRPFSGGKTIKLGHWAV